ncbi:MAG: hypothetical protein GY719_05590 [bacterium]|nr:hypothetical protein [bacterium]
MITRSTSVEAAVRCMKHGAADYITKPLDFDRVRSRRRDTDRRGDPPPAGGAGVPRRI